VFSNSDKNRNYWPLAELSITNQSKEIPACSKPESYKAFVNHMQHVVKWVGKNVLLLHNCRSAQADYAKYNTERRRVEY
jgi:hypothetical protein